MQSRIERQNPYVGPRAFASSEQELFFGRDREINDLVNLIYAYDVVLLNAQSGAGKSSLLNAGIIPRLTKENHQILGTRIRDPLPDSIYVQGSYNFFVFKTIVSWSNDDSDPQRFVPMTFWQFLEKGERLLDQNGEPVLRVLIFDQLEDLFTFHLRHWEDRRGFFGQLGEALNKDTQLRVVLSIREEYVSRLGAYADLLPGKLRVRYYLEHLRHKAAVEAIQNPLNGTGRSFADKAADELATNLARIHVKARPGEEETIPGEFVQPVQLQIVCQNLWEHLPASLTQIKSEQITVLGDVNHALAEFYKRSIRTTVDRTKINERRLRNWFQDKLITAERTPGMVHRGQEETEGIPNRVVDLLDELRIIRQEPRSGELWYELAHDRFVIPILNSNRDWREKYERRRGIRILAFSLLAVTVVAAALLVIQAYSSLLSTNELYNFQVAQANWAATRSGLGGFSIEDIRSTPFDTFFATATAQSQVWTPQSMMKHGVEMVLVPAGCTWLGTNTGEPNSQAAFQQCFNSPFWIDRYEVTNSEFQQSGLLPRNEQPPEMPRTQVSLQQAQNYCHWRDPKASVPTEVQWEYAARGLNSLVFPWGNNFVPENVVYSGNRLVVHDQPSIVGSRQPNGMLLPSRLGGRSWVGAYDMSGNVTEWTSSPFSSDSAADDSAQVVLRGGSYASTDSIYLTTTYRKGEPANQPLASVGFRCVSPAT